MDDSAGRTVRAALGAALAIAVLTRFSMDLPDSLEAFLHFRHRSGWTHSALVPLAVYFVATLDRRAVIMRFISMAVSLGVAIHLSFDLFPTDWQGYALINLHGLGTLRESWSQIWVGLGLFVSVLLVALAASSLRGRGARKVGSLFSTLGSAYFFITYSRQEDAFFWPAVSFITCWVAASVLSKLGQRNRPPIELSSS